MSHCAQYPYLNPTQFNTLYTEIRGKVWKAPLLKDCDVSTYQSPFCPSDSSAAAQAKDRSAVGTSPSGCWVVRVWKHQHFVSLRVHISCAVHSEARQTMQWVHCSL